MQIAKLFTQTQQQEEEKAPEQPQKHQQKQKKRQRRKGGVYRPKKCCFYKPENEAKYALGRNPEAGYSNLYKHFPRMKKPKRGEWLDCHPERGQTFTNYERKCKNYVKKNRKVIYLQPLENLPKQFQEGLQTFCQAFFTGLDVRVRPVVKIDNKNKNQRIKVISRVNDWTENFQYNATDILGNLSFLQASVKDAFCVAGFLMTDLFQISELTGEAWNFIFGVA